MATLLDAWYDTTVALTVALTHRTPKDRPILWELHGDPRCATCAGQATWAVHDTNPARPDPTEADHPFEPRVGLLTQIVHTQPLAEACTNPGDGLRSPTLDSGSRSLGAHTDPVGHTGDAHLRATGHPNYTGPTTDTPTAKTPKATALAASATHRRNITDHLRRASITDDPGLRHTELLTARDEALRALGHLHRLLPRQTDIDNQRFTNAGDPGCASCRRATNAAGTGPHHSPTRTGPRGRTLLCEWCESQTRGERTDWIATHPGQQPPTDDRRFWPPLAAIEFRRDHGHNRITATQLATWRTDEKRARKTKRKKAS